MPNQHHAFKRTDRINDVLRRAISSFILTEVKDPLLASWVTITQVEVAGDLQNARIAFRVIANDGLTAAVQEHWQTAGELKWKAKSAQWPSTTALITERLNHAAGFIRNYLGKELTMKRIPHLHFFYDDTPETLNSIESLLAQIKDA